MNRVLLVLALPLMLVSVARAQPDARELQPGLKGPFSPPEMAVLKFVQDVSIGNEFSFSSDVVGARVGYYGPDEWNVLLRAMPALNAFRALKMQDIRVENQTEDEATVVLSLGEEGLVGDPDRVSFQVRQVNGGSPNQPNPPKVWRIVPPSVDDVLARPLDKTPLFQLAAVMALRDPRVLAAIEQQGGLNQANLQDQGLSQLKQLGLGVLQFVQDYDLYFSFDDAARERAISPYTKNTSLFTIAGTKSEKWHFNDNLSALPMTQVKEPARTVLFYDGDAPSNDHLNFRFDDKTLIGFADGHCKALSKDELKDLVWKP